MRMELIQKLHLNQTAGATAAHVHSDSCSHDHGGAHGHSHSHGPAGGHGGRTGGGGHGHSHGPGSAQSEQEPPHVHGPDCAHGHSHGVPGGHSQSMQQRLKAKHAAAAARQIAPHVHSAACRHGHGNGDGHAQGGGDADDEDDDHGHAHPHHAPRQVHSYDLPTVAVLPSADLPLALTSLKVGSAAITSSTPSLRLAYSADPSRRPLSSPPPTLTLLALDPTASLLPPRPSSSPCSICSAAKSGVVSSASSEDAAMQRELRLHHCKVASEVEESYGKRGVVSFAPGQERGDLSKWPDCMMEVQLIEARLSWTGPLSAADGSLSKSAQKKAKRRAKERARREEDAVKDGTAPPTECKTTSDEADDEASDDEKNPASSTSSAPSPSPSPFSAADTPVTVLRVLTRMVLPPPLDPVAATAFFTSPSASVEHLRVFRHELLFPSARLSTPFSAYQAALDALLSRLRQETVSSAGEGRAATLFSFPVHLQLWADRCEWSGVVDAGQGDGVDGAAEEARDAAVREEQALVNAALTGVWKVWDVKQMSCNVFPLGHAALMRDTWEREQAPVQRFACV